MVDTGERAVWWKAGAAFAAAILPALAVWLAKVVIWPRPFWIHFYDPEAIYFYAGLDLLRGELPDNVDNPGTPVQMLSAAIAAFTGATPARYEAFVGATHGVELLLAIAGAAIVFYGVLGGAALLVRVTGVWLYFAAPQALERMDVWSPEIFYWPIGAAVLALFRRWLDRPSPRSAAVIGFLCGFGTAVKFVFLPWPVALVLTFLLGRRMRDTTAALAGAIAGFVIGTLPVASQYGRMARQLLFLSGTGHAYQTWPDLLLNGKTWLVLMGLVAVAVTISCRRGGASLLTAFCVLVLILSIAASARNPSFRYLLPTAIALIGLFASVSDRKWQMIVFVCVALVLGRTALQDVSTHRQRIAEGERLRARIEAAVPKDAVVLYGWRTPIPSFALRIMTSDARDLAEVSRLYPRQGHVNPWSRRLYLPEGAARWDYAVVGEEDARWMGGRELGKVERFVILKPGARLPAADATP